MHDPSGQAAYEISEHGLIRIKMPNLDPNHAGEYYCVTLGTDKDALAEAMVGWLSDNDYGERD